MDLQIKYNGPTVIAQVRSFKATFNNRIIDSLEQAAKEVLVPAVKKRLLANRSIFHGNLISSIGVESEVTVFGPRVTVGSFGVPYALAVEKGTGPQSSVNYPRILEWVKVKNGLTGQAAVNVALAVYNTLRQKGAVPHPYLSVAFDHSKDLFVKRFKDLMRR